MKKIYFALLILSAIFGLSVFVSCSNDSDVVLPSEKFVGEWIQTSLETKIVISEPGSFRLVTQDDEFAGITGTYVTTTTGATILIDGIEEEYSLVFIEKDVFKVELPQDIEGDAYFVKERDTEINFNGTWKDSDNLINLKINDVNDSAILSVNNQASITNCDFEEEDNAFILLANVDPLFPFQVGSGVISASGKAYVYCLAPDGEWLSTVLIKSGI